MELGFTTHIGRATLGSGYTFLAATYQSEDTVDGSSNSTNETAESGVKGLEGSIDIVPGDRMPLARHVEVYGELQVTRALWRTRSRRRLELHRAGNENGQHEATHVHLSSGKRPDMPSSTSRRIASTLARDLAQATTDNRRYYSAAQLGPNGFTDTGPSSRVAPAVNGEFPVSTERSGAGRTGSSSSGRASHFRLK